MGEVTVFDDFFGNRLALLRIDKGVSARDMSLSLGQSANYINKIENKKAFPSMQAFFYICEYLDVTPKQFFDEHICCPSELGVLMENAKGLDADGLRLVNDLIKRMNHKA